MAARVEVAQYLDARRLITSTVQIGAPEYRFVSVEVDVAARKRTNKQDLQAEIDRRLYKLINPVNGGPDFVFVLFRLTFKFVI